MLKSLIFFTVNIICVAMHFIEIGITLYTFNNVKRYVRRMGCNTFKTVDKIKERYTAFDAAVSVLKSLYVMRLDDFLQVIYGFRKRFTPYGKGCIIIFERFEYSIKCIFNRIYYNINFSVSVRREVNLLLILILGNICDIHAVITHTFEIAYGVEDFRHNQFIACCKSVAVDPYNVRGQRRLTFIYKTFSCFHLRKGIRIVLIDHSCGCLVILYYCLTHLCYKGFTLFQSDNRRVEKHRIQLHKFLIRFILLIFSDYLVTYLYNLIRDYKHEYTCSDIEQKMNICNVTSVYYVIKEAESYSIMQGIYKHHKEYSTEYIEKQVTYRYFSGFLV